MSGGGRKRTSKWDLKESPQHPLEGGHSDAWNESFNDKKSPTGWRTPKFSVSIDQKWVEETNDCFKNDNTVAWDRDENCNIKLSPGLDSWRQERKTLSSSRSYSRSHRGRSRSRSRSRSKSRSPGCALDSNRSRSGVSNEICRSFASGKCWRGERCQYLHSGNQKFEDRRHTESSVDRRDNRGSAWSGASGYSAQPDTREYSARNGRSIDFREGGTDRKGRDTSSEHFFDHETRWGGNIPCRFYPTGNCRNGRNCRFSHHGVDGRPGIDRGKTVHNLDDGENFKGFPCWTDSKTSSWTDSKTLDSSKWDKWDSKSDSEKDFFENTADNDRSGEISKSELIIENTNPELGGSKAMDVEIWQNKMEEPASLSSKAISPNNTIFKEEIEYVSQNSNSIFDIAAAEQKIHPHPSSTSVQPIVYGEPFSDYNPISSEAYPLSLPSDDKNAGEHWLDLKFSAQVPNSFNLSNNRSIARPPLTSDMSEHSQLELFSREQPVVVSDAASHGHQTQLPDPIREENSEDLRIQLQLLENESKKLGIPVADASCVATGISSSQDVVNSEQLAQLTSLSASLAQLLGNGQQLPQLFAALNSSGVVEPLCATPNSVGLDSQLLSTSIQPQPTVGSEKLYDPLSDAVEPVNDGVVVGGSSSKSIILMDLNADKSVGDHGMGETNRIVAESKKSVEEAPKATKLSNAGGNEKVDAMKKSKDPKGIRAFKFALAEFVKELLKPTWKDGQIDKDGYKAIAKKVVDKVTNTIGASIPQKDKIDDYLSLSKPKLTKLVQAYVERHQKS